MSLATIFSRSAVARLATLISLSSERGALRGCLALRGLNRRDDPAVTAFMLGTLPLTKRLRVFVRCTSRRHGRAVGSIVVLFTGNAAALARLVEQMATGVSPGQVGDVLPVEAQGYLCQHPEGFCRAVRWMKQTGIERSAFAWHQGTLREARVSCGATVAIYAGKHFVARLNQHKLEEEMRPFKAIMNPENVMAAKAKVRGGVAAAVAANPGLLTATGVTDAHDALEVLVGQAAGEELFRQCQEAGLCQPEESELSA